MKYTRSCGFRGFDAFANAAPNNASCLVRAMASNHATLETCEIFGIDKPTITAKRKAT